MRELIKKITQYLQRIGTVGWSKNLFLESCDLENSEVFIRQYSFSVKRWIGDNADYKDLAEKHLESKKGNCSVYQIDSILNEAKILLVFYTTYGRSETKKHYGIRIPKNEIEKLGLNLVQTNGTTDVEDVDKLHWEIVGPEHAFEQLAELISRGIKNCEDRFRVLEKDQVRDGLKNLANLPGVPEPVREKCLKALK